MYTLNGRMKFEVALADENIALFEQQKLREIVLERIESDFRLSFYFSLSEEPYSPAPSTTTSALPDYVNVIHPPAPRSS